MNRLLLLLLTNSLVLILSLIQEKSPSIFKRGNDVFQNSEIRSSAVNNSKVLNISTITWNLAEKSPSEKDCVFLHSYRNSDIVVIGIQECEDIRPRRTEGHRSRKWKQLQKEGLGRSFVSIAQHKLGGMQIGVFIKRKNRKLVKGMQLLEVACGIGNVVANKGAVMVLLRILDKSLLFVNAHLAAHQNKVKERNKDYERIANTIIEKVSDKWKSKNLKKVLKTPKILSKKLKKDSKSHKIISPDWSDCLDSIVFLGDLNYRTDLPRLEVERWYEKFRRGKEIIIDWDELYSLTEYDQLRREMFMNKVFVGFNEGVIRFPPTFKFDKGFDRLDSSSKARAPAWTDRILYSSSSSRCFNLKKYYSLDVRSSDHRPVGAEFELFLT